MEFGKQLRKAFGAEGGFDLGVDALGVRRHAGDEAATPPGEAQRGAALVMLDCAPDNKYLRSLLSTETLALFASRLDAIC